MLAGYKKRLVKEVISYYIDTTGLSSQKFIKEVVTNSSKRDLNDLSYQSWLAVKSFKLLEEHEITLADCLEFNNLATQLKLERKGMNVTFVWKKEIANFIKESDISSFELLELSDKNSELNYVDDLNKEINYIEMDNNETNFFNTVDFDINNRYLFDLLPLNIQKAIKLNLPIFINFNPYLEHMKNIEFLIEEMRLFGFSSKYILNIHYGALFKLIRFCEEYNLTNVRIGFFGPLDMYYEKEEYGSFYKIFKKNFKFNSGICFNPKSVGVKDKAEFIGYTIWDRNILGNNKPVVLQEKIQHTDDTILSGSERLLRGSKESLYDWEVSSIICSGDFDTVPTYLNIQTKGEKSTNRYNNVICYQANTSHLLRSYKRIGVYSVPVGECTAVTVENFYKSVASYAVRSCLSEDIKTPVYLSNPDVEIEGYANWLADAVVYFLFSSTNMTKSYREKDLILPNKLFPLKFSEIRKFVTDVNIINDMNAISADNLVFTQTIDNIFKNLSKEALDLFTFCKRKIIESVTGKIRENYGYKDSLVAWDASFYQIRQIDGLLNTEDEDFYAYSLSKLKASLYEGVYKYGFVSEFK